MPETGGNSSGKMLEVRHRGRISQIGIFFRKFLRMFVYQNDWKVLPMAAIIAGLVGFVLSGDFMANMEGTLTGAFAIVCVNIWNGSFNSIQVICRERDVIKREHRSGMHVSSYIMAHLMYQLLLCILQTVVTLIVLNLVGMKFDAGGLFTPWLVVDIGITLLLITYAADILSLWISTLVHSTTTAMTIMPFVLIFQLVFSGGGFFNLPDVADPIVRLTISSPGLKAMASQTQVNSLPYSAVSNMLNLVNDVELEGFVTIGQALDILSDTENETIAELRAIRIGENVTLREIGEYLLKEDEYRELRDTVLAEDMTVGAAIGEVMAMGEMDEVLDTDVGFITTIGEAVDFLASEEAMQSRRDEGVTVNMTVGDLLDLAGRDETRALIEKKASEALYDDAYAYTKENVIKNWIHLMIFVVVFSLLSIITLEFIDKDKR